MATVTRLLFGPTDHGRLVDDDELDVAEYAEGFTDEIIDGRLVVAPAAGLSEGVFASWLFEEVRSCARANPAIAGCVHNKARVFVPNRTSLTVPEPDLAAYREHPLDLPEEQREWQFLSPFLVGKVLVEGDPRRDLIRNVELYWHVPSILEYWILDGRDAEPVLQVRRRQADGWQPLEVPFGDAYTTPLLRAFELVIDPRR